jgi:hypothetical protein
MHKSDVNRIIIITFFKKERTAYIYKQQEKSLMLRKNNNPYFQETFKLWLLIPAFFVNPMSICPQGLSISLSWQLPTVTLQPVVTHNSLNTIGFKIV